MNFTKPKILAFSLLCLLPVALMILGARQLLFSSRLFNLTFALSFIVLPVFTILLFALVLYLVNKRFARIILNTLVFILFVVLFFTISAFGLTERLYLYENEQVKSHYTQNVLCMPALSEFSNTEKLEFYNYTSYGLFGIIDYDTDTLICKYSEDEYLTHKKLLDKKYIYQNNLLDDSEYSNNPVAKINGYVFRALSSDEYELTYPKEIVFTATNDEENEILYMYFYDIELDYIESLEEFILNDCGFKYVR